MKNKLKKFLRSTRLWLIWRLKGVPAETVSDMIIEWSKTEKERARSSLIVIQGGKKDELPN